MKSWITLLFLLLFSMLTGCATAPTHKSLKNTNLPKQIPLRDFVANTKSNFSYKISPDGKKVAWVAVKGIKLAIFIRELASNQVYPIKSADNIWYFQWGQDSDTIFYHKDQGGNENTHVFALSISKPELKPIDLTPLKGVKATIIQIPRNDPEHIFIQHNQRDKSVFDLFKLSVKTHKLVKVAENPGTVFHWLIDDNGKLRARLRKVSDTRNRLELLSANGRHSMNLQEKCILI